MTGPEDFRKSDYLIEGYINAAGSLRDFDLLEAAGDIRGAGEALQKSAHHVCSALRRLAYDDPAFWEALAAMRSSVVQHRTSIERMLDEIELFISQEERILLEYKILPPHLARRLLSDLVVTMKAFRADPAESYLEQLRDGITEAASIVCGHAEVPLKEPSDSLLIRFFLTTREGLGVLGGSVTIVVNGITSSATANLLPLASVVGGAASSLGFLEWLKRWKRKRD